MQRRTERILIIEDDPDIHEMLRHAFAREGWELIHAETGEEGLQALQSKGADCVILDIMLPGMDGLKTLRKIRKDAALQTLPVILCTARGEDADVITGLELGADDYVIKPYSPRVLAARIRAGLRRNEHKASAEAGLQTVWQYGKLVLDREKHSVYLGETPIDLLVTEFDILAEFMSHPDIVFTRQKLIAAVHGSDYPVTDRSIDVQIMGLRRKLGESGGMIETIRGIGYRFGAINDRYTEK
ncbi:MAG: response regulator transcription factor [Treponema sp.]|nr:response regulator transcription factor [Treponema sp.]